MTDKIPGHCRPDIKVKPVGNQVLQTYSEIWPVQCSYHTNHEVKQTAVSTGWFSLRWGDGWECLATTPLIEWWGGGWVIITLQVATESLEYAITCWRVSVLMMIWMLLMKNYNAYLWDRSDLIMSQLSPVSWLVIMRIKWAIQLLKSLIRSLPAILCPSGLNYNISARTLLLSLYQCSEWTFDSMNEGRFIKWHQDFAVFIFCLIRKVARQPICRVVHRKTSAWISLKTKIKNVQAPGGPFLSCFAKHYVWTFGFFVIIRVIQTSILEPFKTFLLCLYKISHWSPTNLCDIDF